MTYPYLTLPDGTEMVHSQVIDDMGVPTVYVYFERPTSQGFDEARCRLPGGEWYHVIGFSREELDYFSQLVRQNKPLIYKLAASGGRDLGKEKKAMDCETVTLRCDDNAEALVFKKYNWAKGKCDFEIAVEDSYCGGTYMGIKGRFRRAWHAFFAKPIFYSGVYCTDRQRMLQFLERCLELTQDP